MNPLLIILNPRRIQAALDAFKALGIDKAYLTGRTEMELAPVIAELVADTDYSHYLLISDDGIVRQQALDAVLALLPEHPVVGGWSNQDFIVPQVNLHPIPLPQAAPCSLQDTLYHWAQVMAYPDEAVPTFFLGGCLTGMSREMWLRFPYECYPNAHGGGASDYNLCWRLQEAGIPMVAAREGFVTHLKDDWLLGANHGNERRLLLGPEYQSVRFERC